MNTVEAKSIKMIIVEDYKLVRVGLRSVLNDDRDISVIGEAEDGREGHGKPGWFHFDQDYYWVDNQGDRDASRYWQAHQEATRRATAKANSLAGPDTKVSKE